MRESADYLLEALDVHFGYRGEDVLRGASLSIAPGEIVALRGASGSGKSTLLGCLAGLIRPRVGMVRYGSTALEGLSDQHLSRLRLKHFGFVFQFGELVPELRVAENVELPLRLAGWGRSAARQTAVERLAEVGIEHLASRLPTEISGGEQQRVAVARSVVHRPSVVFCDEPTGSLDRANTELVLDLIVAMARSCDAAVVLVTHDDNVAQIADRVVILEDGSVVETVLISHVSDE